MSDYTNGAKLSKVEESFTNKHLNSVAHQVNNLQNTFYNSFDYQNTTIFAHLYLQNYSCTVGLDEKHL